MMINKLDRLILELRMSPEEAYGEGVGGEGAAGGEGRRGEGREGGEGGAGGREEGREGGVRE